MSFTLAYDVTAGNFPHAPQGAQLCGYDTGSGGIAWTAAMWAAHPGAVHIDQAPSLDGDVTADVLDVEAGAVPVGSPLIATWAKAALAAFASAKRPGQRKPLLYQSAANVTANVNALIAGGVDSGVGLWVANWSLTQGAAVAEVLAASGPFPVQGIQFNDAGDFDVDVFSTAWLSDVSASAWVFGPVRGAKFAATGATTFTCSGYSPGVPEPLGVGVYQVACSEGDKLGADIAGYPVEIPKSDATSKWSYDGKGLKPSTTYTIGVRAIAAGPVGHAGPWVTGTVKTSA